jgi:hypothetical protein
MTPWITSYYENAVAPRPKDTTSNARYLSPDPIERPISPRTINKNKAAVSSFSKSLKMLKSKIVQNQNDDLINELGIAQDTRTKLVREELRKKYHKNNREIQKLNEQNSKFIENEDFDHMSLYEMYHFEEVFMIHLRNNFLKFIAIVDDNTSSLVDQQKIEDY